MVALSGDGTRSVHYAKQADIDAIMQIENESFAPGIREEQKTFETRLGSFPEGFFLLKTGGCFQQSPHQNIAGYFCAEIWNAIPEPVADSYHLDHAIDKLHSESGSILYVSSFAVRPDVRGGAGRFLFNASLSATLSAFPGIETIHFIVHEEWLAARHIYETEGFCYAGIIPAFFQQARKTGAALIMTKSIPRK